MTQTLNSNNWSMIQLKPYSTYIYQLKLLCLSHFSNFRSKQSMVLKILIGDNRCVGDSFEMLVTESMCRFLFLFTVTLLRIGDQDSRSFTIISKLPPA